MTVLVRGMVEHFMPSLGFRTPSPPVVPPNGGPPLESVPPAADPSAAAPSAAAPAAAAPYGAVPGAVGQPAVPTVVPAASPDGVPGSDAHFAPDGAYPPNGTAVPGVPGGPLVVDGRVGGHAVMPGSGVDRSMVIGGGVSESGVVVMLPGVGPDGRPRAARIPVALYVSESRPPSSLFSLLATAPAFVRYGLFAFAVLTVCMTFVYLGSTLVTSRYVFSEVETAPGRSTFYRVDRWTGRWSGVRRPFPSVRRPRSTHRSAEQGLEIAGPLRPGDPPFPD